MLRILSIILGISLVLTGCVQTNNKATPSSDELAIQQVNANMYIGDFGKRLDSLTYEFQHPVNINHFEGMRFIVHAIFSATNDTPSTVSKAIKVTSVKVHGKNLTIGLSDFDTQNLERLQIDSSVKALSTSQLNYYTKIRTVDEFKHHTFTAKDGTTLSYWLYLPNSQSPTPLMVWEHGGGEVLKSSYPRANLEANRGATTWIEHHEKTAVLSVQYPENYSFGIADVPDQFEQMQRYNTAKYELIQTLIKSGEVTPNRVYISGASSGGGAALRFIMQYPKLFAAALVIAPKDTIVPLSDRYDLAYKFNAGPNALRLSQAEYESSYQEMENALSDSDITSVPMWFAHALNDHICTRYTSTMMYDILKRKGAKNIHITLYSDDIMHAYNTPYNHFSWVPTLDNARIINWVYAQRRP
ncbi:carboxylesterase family protein [Vibrio nitrifigilis]|uniref:Prolyl oligopeptidase family serine peptidase n=1 Tax=Vibrio nitrifigilis TaxID=2789781 RepID=A0ABS0GMP2_9VIBR|nr:prolyl oligopeptidase family serine peptidase [Vibrio nitrifigilis]MBF8999726.1 prolyl oligopeptidase family serine peptidase [Vibrio nitrifigilis]MBF9003612.1 prolyl oligopeptidase family serine peptidase [Vibrio nitrifigilis]